MADFVNQAIMQQRRAGGDPQGDAIARNSAALAQSLQNMAQRNLQQQQADAATQQREMSQALTVMDLDWVPVDEKVRVANRLGKQFGIQGEITADGIQPYRQLLTDMQKDFEDGRDLSRWSHAVELFSANPKFVDPSQRPMIAQAQQQLREQQVDQVASAQVPSVEGGPEAISRTQEAKERLALFDSITPDDPEAGKKLESFTQVYGTADRFRQQIEADRLVVADEEQRLKEREKYASALRMAPAEIAKLSAASLDPKTMLLPLISRAIQEKGVDGLDEKDRNRLDAFFTINGQPEKLAVFSEAGKTNQLKQYQQELSEAKIAIGAIDEVKTVMKVGKERIGTYDAAAGSTLDQLATLGTKLPADQYEQRQAALAQLDAATKAVAEDWEQTVAPVRDGLTKQAQAAKQTVAQLDEQMRRPGVDRVMLAKRKEFAQQQADTYEAMNQAMGVSTDLDLALKRNEIKAIEIDAKTGETPDARATAAALLPGKKQELAKLEQDMARNQTKMDLYRERMARYAKLSQARITAGDRKLEQQQQNGVMASAFLGDWIASGFKASADTWYSKNAEFFDGADPKLFMDVVKPAMESRKEIALGQAERELLAAGDAKRAGPIAAKYGVKPSDILGVLKDPNRPLSEVNVYNEKQTVEQAGKLANVNQAINEVQSVRQVFVNPDGSINRAQLLAGTLNVPFTAGKGAEELINRSVEIKLRAATGAAARQDEIALYRRLFGPSTLDSDETIRYKLDSLENWMSTVVDTTDPRGDLRKRAEGMMDEGTVKTLTTKEYRDLRQKFPQAPSREIVQFLKTRKANP